jgi:chromosome segregation ATPase
MIRTTRKEDAEDLLIISLIKDKTELEETIKTLREELDGYKSTEDKIKKYLVNIKELQQDKETYLQEIKNYDDIVKELQKGLPKKVKELQLENVELKKQIEEKNKIIQGYLSTIQVDKDIQRRDNLMTTLDWARRDYGEAIKKGLMDVAESNRQRLLKYVPILIELERKAPFNKRKFYFTAENLESEINLRYLKGITATEVPKRTPIKHPTPTSLLQEGYENWQDPSRR